MRTIDVHTVNPYIRVATRSVLKQGSVIKQRIIFDYELIYIEDGSMTLYFDGAPYQCNQGHFILIRPGLSHSFDCTKQALSQPHIHFDLIYTPDSEITPVSFKDLPMLTPSERSLIQKDLFSEFPRTPFVVFSKHEQALDLFYKVIVSFSSNRMLSAKGAMTELIAELIHDNFQGCLSAEQEKCYDIAQQLKDFIDSTFGLHTDLDALEKQFSYSKFYLERQFKEKHGISPIAYANTKRMELAKTLLKNQSVSEVTEKTGFSSIYAFSRAFKNKYGIPPSEYKKSKKYNER
ncbi:MAG: AraC family transcriptional regulator [Ruminococcaceae bacterium]|nr:AraC family transcriptional regulator [Oscillospiraceae bacterium]